MSDMIPVDDAWTLDNGVSPQEWLEARLEDLQDDAKGMQVEIEAAKLMATAAAIASGIGWASIPVLGGIGVASAILSYGSAVFIDWRRCRKLNVAWFIRNDVCGKLHRLGDAEERESYRQMRRYVQQHSDVDEDAEEADLEHFSYLPPARQSEAKMLHLYSPIVSAFLAHFRPDERETAYKVIVRLARRYGDKFESKVSL